MNSLSKREKTLIYTLVCFVLITVGLYYFIFPIMRTCLAQQSLLSEKKMAAMQMQMSIEAMPTTEALTVEMKGKLAELSSDYFAQQDNEQLDRFITQLVLKSGLEPTSLTITDPVLTEILPYAPQVSAADAEAALTAEDEAAIIAEAQAAAENGEATAQDGDTTDVETSAQDGTAENVVYGKMITADFTVAASGDINDLYALVNTVAESPQVRITRFDYTQKELEEVTEGGAADIADALIAAAQALTVDEPSVMVNMSGVDNIYDFNIDFEVFMYGKPT